jgi:hypothetical protein
MLLAAILLQIEDTKVLAIAITVKITVGVVKNNGLTIFRGERIVTRGT